ncbi:MAG: hypothetical protein ACTSPE_10970 [Candidatus Thorarchaeota archaeon]
MRFSDKEMGLAGRRVTAARAISRLTPAPLFNLYIAILIAYTSPIGLGPILEPIGVIIICFLLMVVLPLAPIVLSAWRGHTDLDVSDKSRRTVFFVFSVLCYAMAYVVYGVYQCHVMQVLAAAYVVVTTATTIITTRTKVSVHAVGVAGPSTAVIYMYGPIGLPLLLLWVTVAWSRVVLKQHTYRQTFLGAVTGAVFTLLTYALLYGR